MVGHAIDDDNNKPTACAGDKANDEKETKLSASPDIGTDGTGATYSEDAVDAPAVDNLDEIPVRTNGNFGTAPSPLKLSNIVLLIARENTNVKSDLSLKEADGSYPINSHNEGDHTNSATNSAP